MEGNISRFQLISRHIKRNFLSVTFPVIVVTSISLDLYKTRQFKLERAFEKEQGIENPVYAKKAGPWKY